MGRKRVQTLAVKLTDQFLHRVEISTWTQWGTIYFTSVLCTASYVSDYWSLFRASTTRTTLTQSFALGLKLFLPLLPILALLCRLLFTSFLLKSNQKLNSTNRLRYRLEYRPLEKTAPCLISFTSKIWDIFIFVLILPLFVGCGITLYITKFLADREGVKLWGSILNLANIYMVARPVRQTDNKLDRVPSSLWKHKKFKMREIKHAVNLRCQALSGQKNVVAVLLEHTV